MDLEPILADIRRQVETAVQGGGEEERAIAERLVAPLEAAIRLALLDALAAAAKELTVELAPGSVDLRLRGRDPEFVLTSPTIEEPAEEEQPTPVGGVALRPVAEGEEGAISRINLRLPGHLKARIEAAAGSEGLSVNSWLVRAAAAALERTQSIHRRERRTPHGAERYRGWAR
jgi:hypothetical protein